jgi:hypothetical protein
MAEHAPDNKRGFYGSFLEFGTIAGFTAGSLILLATDDLRGSGAARVPASTKPVPLRELSDAEHVPLSRADPKGVYPLPESPVGISERRHAI